ncbi:MAG: biliverdin-producing heme oxygenase [Opitutaceae bacterium]|nr:biliverdin-producing heme oxygenase [Opitutaceae bacterium]
MQTRIGFLARVSGRAFTRSFRMILQRLRHATAGHHHALEATLPFPKSLPEYQARLRWYYGFLAPWEASLERHHPNLGNSPKTRWLEEDLRHFSTDITQVPRCSTLPPVQSLSEALGSLYVWEGSMLGAQTISRQLCDTLGVSNSTGGRFFHGYGEDTASQWNRFRDRLQKHMETGESDTVIASAQLTFIHVQAWMEQCSKHEGRN